MAEEGKRLVPRIEDARLLRMQRQTETTQQVREPGQLSNGVLHVRVA
jgi:hypothetical protein